MKYAKIKLIEDSLTKLGNKELPIAFEIAKNLRACTKITEESEALFKEVFSKYADKDENGNLIQYSQDGKPTTKITGADKMEQFNVEVAKIDNEEHEIVFIKIPKSALSGKDLAANILVPLMDDLITE